MYCSKCGTRLPDNANYCMNCGARVEHFMQPDNMMEYYRSVIDFSYTDVKKSEDNWYNIKDKKSIVYIKAFNESGCRLLDFDCSPVFRERYDDFGCFISKDGIEYFKVKRGDKWCLRTKERILTGFNYDSIDFCWGSSVDGFVCVKSNNKYGFIQLSTGRTVFDCSFDSIGHLCVQWPDDCFPVSKEGRWGVISLKRASVIRPFVYREEWEAHNNNPVL